MRPHRLLSLPVAVVLAILHPTGEADATSPAIFYGLENSDLRLIELAVGEDVAPRWPVTWTHVVGEIPPNARVSESYNNRIEYFRNLSRPLTGVELRELLELVGFEGESLREAWSVAMKESTGNPSAHNRNSRTGDNSYGLFQINMLGSLGPDRATRYNLSGYDDLFDPVINAEVAYHMSNQGRSFGSWGVGPNAYKGSTLGSYPTWYTKFPEEAYNND
jgi:hypothetical protein